MINLQVILPRGEESTVGKVILQSLEENGRIIGSNNDNKILNTFIYIVEFPNGVTIPYAANIINQNIHESVNGDGQRIRHLVEIIDYSTNEYYLSKDNGMVTTSNGRLYQSKTTAGWNLLCRVNYREEVWYPLKDLKESDPVKVAEFYKSKGLVDELAFAWWVPYTIRKRDVIISAIKSRLKVASHKYSVEVPRSYAHAIELDRRNNNTQWKEAYDLECYNVSVAFEILPMGKSDPSVLKKSSRNMIWDVKMDFTKKCRFVKDGYKTPEPKDLNYSGVVARDSIRIALTYAVLNDVGVMAAEIRNAYLQAPSSEKNYLW